MTVSMQPTQAYPQGQMIGSVQEVVDMNSLGWQNDPKAKKRESRVEVEEILMGFAIIGLEAPVTARPSVAATMPVQQRPTKVSENAGATVEPKAVELVSQGAKQEQQEVLARLEQSASMAAAMVRLPGDNLFHLSELPIAFRAESGFQVQDVEDVAVFLARNEALLEKFDYGRIWKNASVAAVDLSSITPKMFDELVRFLLHSKMEEGLSTIVLEMDTENGQRIVDAFLADRLSREEMGLALGVSSSKGLVVAEEILDIIDFSKKLRIDVLVSDSSNSHPLEVARTRQEFADQLFYLSKSRPDEKILIIASGSLVNGAEIAEFGYLPSVTAILNEAFGVSTATVTFMGMKQPDDTTLSTLKDVFNYAAIALELESLSFVVPVATASGARYFVHLPQEA